MLGMVGVQYGGVALIENLMGAKWDVFGVMPLSFSALGLLWFVRCLIVITLVSPIFVMFSRKWGGVLILIGYAAMVWFDVSHPEPEHGWVTIW